MAGALFQGPGFVVEEIAIATGQHVTPAYYEVEPVPVRVSRRSQPASRISTGAISSSRATWSSREAAISD